MQTKEQLKKWLDENLVEDLNDLIEFLETHEERRAAQVLLKERLNLDPSYWAANFTGYEGSLVILADLVDKEGLFYSTYVIVDDCDDDTVKCIPECLITAWQMGNDMSDVTIEVDKSDILLGIEEVKAYAEMITSGEMEDDAGVLIPDAYQLEQEVEEREEAYFEHEQDREEFEPVINRLVAV